DPDVRRQPALTDGRRIERLDAAGEEAVEKRLGEPTLQRRAGARERQRQAREDRELHTTIRLSQAMQCVDDEDRFADAHRNSEPEIVAYTIDDGLRAAIRIGEDNAPCDVCLFREHSRNPYSLTSARPPRATQGHRRRPAVFRAFAVRGHSQAALLSAALSLASASLESDVFSTRGL